jgi:hypothetical protein
MDNTSNKKNNRNNRLSMNNNNKNTKLNNITNTRSTSSIVVLVVIIILVLILLFFIGRMIYNRIYEPKERSYSEKTLLDAVNDGTNEYIISSSELSSSNFSNEYTLSFWVYVDDYSYRQGKRKYILKRGEFDGNINPIMYLDPYQNNLHLNFTLMNTHQSEPATTTPNVDNPDVNNPDANNPDANNPDENNPDETNPDANNPDENNPDENNPEPNTFTNVEGFGDCGNVDFEQTNRLYARNLKGISTNDVNGHEIKQEYNNDYFDLIQGNRVCGIKNRGCNYMDEDVLPAQNVNKASENTFAEIEGFTDGNNRPECRDQVTEPSDEDFNSFLENAGSCVVQRFPVQKWVHVVLCQYNDVIDVYVDGKLRSSCVLGGYPAISTGDLALSPFGGFSGELTNLVYYNTGINSETVYDIYKRGPYNKNSIFAKIPTYVYYLIAFITLLLIIFLLL